VGQIVNKTKGKFKQAVGALTGNRKLKREGQRDELRGKVESGVKQVKDAVK
jgi:uncharacterized protein YjbJ (UPF0337 family)